MLSGPDSPYNGVSPPAGGTKGAGSMAAKVRGLGSYDRKCPKTLVVWCPDWRDWLVAYLCRTGLAQGREVAR